MELIHEKDRIYSLSEDGRVLAEITFPSDGPDTVNINHSYVDPSLRGQGAADKLVRAAAEELTSRGLKCSASCTYAAGWFAAHPEFSDLLC